MYCACRLKCGQFFLFEHADGDEPKISIKGIDETHPSRPVQIDAGPSAFAARMAPELLKKHMPALGRQRVVPSELRRAVHASVLVRQLEHLAHLRRA